jgi:predicted protein tyrosine phosphatase
MQNVNSGNPWRSALQAVRAVLPDPSLERFANDMAQQQQQRLNVLFICSRNQWRSPTAEAIWRKHPALSVRSAGTSPNARRHVSEDDLRWCGTILVMEEKHRSRLRAEFGRLVEHIPIHVLDIPDEYKYMDPDLVVELRSSVARILGLAPLLDR